jgi:dienelactone hydrolase
MKKICSIFLSMTVLYLFSCNNEPAEQEASASTDSTATTAVPEIKIKTDNVSYKLDTLTMNGFVAYDESSNKKRPAIFIIHEWWGLNDYVKKRAEQLAGMGYIAMAIDLYGNGKQADNPKDAGAAAGYFYKNFKAAKDRFDAAVAKLKEYPQVDTSNMAAIGYCFGGSMVLNIAKMGENLKGVVSFHGNLAGVPAKKELLKASVLVCHGEADGFVKPEEIATFKKQMDAIGADYVFKTYPNAQHAFTNPDATENGKKFNIPISYNAAADTASWTDMKVFFDKVLQK